MSVHPSEPTTHSIQALAANHLIARSFPVQDRAVSPLLRVQTRVQIPNREFRSTRANTAVQSFAVSANWSCPFPRTSAWVTICSQLECCILLVCGLPCQKESSSWSVDTHCVLLQRKCWPHNLRKKI
jgi:hypothetical protein